MIFFFFNDTATTEIYPLSLHDALPIFHDRNSRVHARRCSAVSPRVPVDAESRQCAAAHHRRSSCPPDSDRKSTRLNSSHLVISYAVFCLKKKHSLATSGHAPTRAAATG